MINVHIQGFSVKFLGLAPYRAMDCKDSTCAGPQVGGTAACAFPRLRTIIGVDGAVRRSQGPTTACAL